MKWLYKISNGDGLLRLIKLSNTEIQEYGRW